MDIRIQWTSTFFIIACVQYITESAFWRKTCLCTDIQPTTPRLFSQPANSVIECSLLCVGYDGCATASFDQQNGMCNGFAVKPENIIGKNPGNPNVVYYTPVPIGCLGYGWEWIESKKWCVKINKKKETKTTAREKCLSEGADLIQLPTTESLEFFVHFMNRCWKDCRYTHIGADHIGSGYKWYSGTPVGDMYCNNEPSLRPTDQCLYFTCPFSGNSWCTYIKKRLDDHLCIKTSSVCIKYL